MATYRDYVSLIKNLVDNLPKKYNDKTQQLAYEQGFLIGLIASVMDSDSQMAHTVSQTIKNVKQKS